MISINQWHVIKTVIASWEKSNFVSLGPSWRC
jgi:hypothetical protein